MFISVNWIRDHCPFETTETPERIAERFSLATAEVEGVQRRGENLGQFVAARVEEVQPIPKSQKLSKVKVDVGSGEQVSVVCGAPNVRPGMCAPFAAPGTTVLGKKLSRATIRDVPSEGMLLSEAELEISEDHDGLLELSADVPPGTSLSQLFSNVDDVVLEVDNKSLTHRPDLWGHYGMAREFATIYDTPLAAYPVNESVASAPGDPEVIVQIDDGQARERCLRYCGLRIDGVQIGPSPDWLRHRLLAVGSRPINNIVDITNYILFDLGQPLHAFDLNQLRGGQIIVRMPKANEKMTLLDGRTIELHPEDLLIADGVGPVALAGVMGGEGSQISDSTVSIFLESANFSAAGVRRASHRHGRTDSSARFEKSLDPYQARQGILRAAQMVLDFCPDAKVVGNLQDVGFKPPAPTAVEITPHSITNRLGCEVPTSKVKTILEHLGFQIEEGAGDDAAAWQITVPSWRSTGDVSMTADVVEEVGRIHGYDHIKPFAPQWAVTTPEVNERRVFERQVKNHLTVHCGLSEVITYSMVGAAHCHTFGMDPEVHLKLRNFMSEEHDRLRRELIPIHLEKARDNQRFYTLFGFFEVGRVYLKPPGSLSDPELPVENTRIAGVLAYPEKTESNFYQLRYVVMSLAKSLNLQAPTVEFLEPEQCWVHPAAAARFRCDGREAGSFYRIHPETMRKLELKGDVLAFDVDFDILFEAPRSEFLYQELPRFPDVPFDLSVIAPERTPVGELERIIRESAGEFLRALDVFAIYRGRGLDEGKKSVSFHLVFRASDHTLSAEDVDRLQDSVIAGLRDSGYPLR